MKQWGPLPAFLTCPFAEDEVEAPSLLWHGIGSRSVVDEDRLLLLGRRLMHSIVVYCCVITNEASGSALC